MAGLRPESERRDDQYMPLALKTNGAPVQTGDPYDPFALAHFKQALDPDAKKNRKPGVQGPAAVEGLLDIASIGVNTIDRLQKMQLLPLVYIGHQFVLDPLSNLVYLPTSKAAAARGGGGGGAWGNSSTLPEQLADPKHGGAEFDRLLKNSDLQLFGRLRPDHHVQVSGGGG